MLAFPPFHPGRPPHHHGPPPHGLKIIEATRQNTLVMADGEHFRIDSPQTDGGPDVWDWHFMNLGPGVLWMRWDGRGFARAHDAHSIQVPAMGGYEHISPTMMTIACQGNTTITFTAENIKAG